MYFIVLFTASWIWFYNKADKSRVRELYGIMIYTSFLALWTDLIMIHYKLWSYHGLPHSNFTIPLLLDFSVYPVVAYMFIQNVPMNGLGMLKRTLVWTLFSIVFEWITLLTENIRHLKWWTLGLSFTADIFIYISIWAVFRFYRPAYLTQPPRKKENSLQ